MYEKLKELMLYIADKSAADPLFGALKLNKILFLIDFTAYGIWGKPITEATYVHQKLGPVPFQLLPARGALIDSGAAVLQDREHFGGTQQRLTALREPNMSLFTAEERKLIDEALETLRSSNGTEVSNWTYTLRPWKDTLTGDEIPFYTTFILEDVPIDRDDQEWARAMIKQIKARSHDA